MTESFLYPTERAAIALIKRGIEGPVVMLNLLRFRETADYGATPERAPAAPISGGRPSTSMSRRPCPSCTARAAGFCSWGRRNSG